MWNSGYLEKHKHFFEENQKILKDKTINCCRIFNLQKLYIYIYVYYLLPSFLCHFKSPRDWCFKVNKSMSRNKNRAYFVLRQQKYHIVNMFINLGLDSRQPTAVLITNLKRTKWKCNYVTSKAYWFVKMQSFKHFFYYYSARILSH